MCHAPIEGEKPLHSPAGEEGEVWRFLAKKKNSETLEVP